MNVFRALVLGSLQGLTEFLPISSSAHLVLVPWVLKWPDPGLAFDVAMHLGTLLAVLGYFHRDFLRLAIAWGRSLKPSTRDFRQYPEQRLVWMLLLASLPTALAGALFEPYVERLFRTPRLITLWLALFAGFLWGADRLGTRGLGLEQIRWNHALLIGLSQAIAILPGVSRSGVTMTAALALGLHRAAAARFSFLLSVPIIIGANLVEIRHLPGGACAVETGLGVLTAAFVGALAIHGLLRHVTTHNYNVFVIYRLGLAAVILAVDRLQKS